MQQVFARPHSLKDVQTHFCPGCHHGTVHRLVADALDHFGVQQSTIGVASGLWGWLAVLLAPLYIVILMLSATTGAELAQATNYGDDPAFEEYVARTGLLLPRLRG